MNNYKNIISKIPIFAAFILLFISCNNWLDVYPEDSLTQDEFWKTKDDVLAARSAVYDALRGTNEKSLLLGEIRADHLSIDNGYNDDYTSIQNNLISTTNNAVKWGEYYHVINLANSLNHFAPIVQDLDQTLTQRDVEIYEAEMTFIKSLCYFYLVRIWKDVPLVKSATVSDTVEFYLPKSPEHEVLTYIENELLSAIDIASEDNLEKGYANKYAIQTLLADVYLWHGNYQACVNICNEVISTGLFGLESKTNWFNNFYPGNSAIEGIFELQYGVNLAGDQQGNPFYEYPYLYNNIDVDLLKLGLDRDNDVRYCGGKGPEWKYRGATSSGRGSERRPTSDANYMYYRYVDLLLIKAEAQAELGNMDDANDILIQVAERAGISQLPTFDLKDFRENLLVERSREFGAEGKRWFDLLRHAKKNNFEEKQTLITVLLAKVSNAQELAIMRSRVQDTMSYYLPIHIEEIEVNKNLIQNPFYDR